LVLEIFGHLEEPLQDLDGVLYILRAKVVEEASVHRLLVSLGRVEIDADKLAADDGAMVGFEFFDKIVDEGVCFLLGFFVFRTRSSILEADDQEGAGNRSTG
jgi:hypothetical protein